MAKPIQYCTVKKKKKNLSGFSVENRWRGTRQKQGDHWGDHCSDPRKDRQRFGPGCRDVAGEAMASWIHYAERPTGAMWAVREGGVNVPPRFLV